MKLFFVSVIFLSPAYFDLIGETQAAEGPTCAEEGAFEINDGTCRNYYLCLDDGEKLNPVVLACASSAVFDPAEGRCLSEDLATCLQTTTPLPPTTEAPCVRYGRFPIEDANCKRYFLCYWDGTDYALIANLSCPNSLVFEPILGKCVSPQKYICPSTQALD